MKKKVVNRKKKIIQMNMPRAQTVKGYSMKQIIDNVLKILERSSFETAYLTCSKYNLIDESYAKVMSGFMIKFDTNKQYKILRKYYNPIVCVNTILYAMYKE